MKDVHRPRAFTIVEMLVVIAIIALLIGVLLPAIGRARSQARITQSTTNLRNLGVAHASYAAAWNGRQYTVAVDTISSYGTDAQDAATSYAARDFPSNQDKWEWPPPIVLGWGHRAGNYELQALWITSQLPEDAPGRNFELMEPIHFSATHPDWAYFGWFRIPNGRSFTEHLSGRFYDPVFYAPNDTMVMDLLRRTEDSPDEYTHTSVYGWDEPCWSSYCLSPAALFNPAVMRGCEGGGWQDPWSLPAGFRTPALSHARYPELKTHMLEHHWLQARKRECNPDSDRGTYEGCEPYYFNHSSESRPVTLFYDAHVELVGVRGAARADGRHRKQSGCGLWSRDTPFGENGYVHDLGYDDISPTSFHILTTDGILGRDVISDG